MKTDEIEKIQDRLAYDQKTGEFFFKKHRKKTKIGKAAGSFRKRDGYVNIALRPHDYAAHRLAFVLMLGRFPLGEVDHVNGVRHDNSWDNLREVSSRENKMNSSTSKRNKSGICGVRYIKRFKTDGRWFSYINVNGAQIGLGSYTNIFDAACARRSAETQYGFHPNHGKRA